MLAIPDFIDRLARMAIRVRSPRKINHVKVIPPGRRNPRQEAYVSVYYKAQMLPRRRPARARATAARASGTACTSGRRAGRAGAAGAHPPTRGPYLKMKQRACRAVSARGKSSADVSRVLFQGNKSTKAHQSSCRTAGGPRPAPRPPPRALLIRG
ncbi:hypothetical protein EVAR_87253_1 [Eumeta japonica]|uniref:Uncharacterized protein n=1 Tax=Eumeta variegata TaxID=151549 RepID=A0A4C1YKY9_EUMVA|nr:hypothetical protein EVAR_87253_1 [Eumeta japonica]